MQGSIYCYNIDDGTWWSIAFGVPKSGTYAITSAIFPTMAYPTSAQTGQYSQWCFRAGQGSSGQSAVFSTKCFNFSTGGDIYYDWNGPGTFSFFQNNPIVVAIQTNTYWFGTETRKRVNKLKALLDTVNLTDVIGDTIPTPTTQESLYLIYNKANNWQYFQGAGVKAFQGNFPVNHLDFRCHINNVGMCRNLSIGFVNKGMNFIRCVGFELDITQGTS
jgi:hypothetical protein